MAHKKRIDLAGRKFGRLTVLHYTKTIKKNAFWLCRCECGKTKEVKSGHLRTSSIKSCGCMNTERLRRRDGSIRIKTKGARAIRRVIYYRFLTALNEKILGSPELPEGITPEEVLRVKRRVRCELLKKVADLEHRMELT